MKAIDYAIGVHPGETAQRARPPRPAFLCRIGRLLPAFALMGLSACAGIRESGAPEPASATELNALAEGGRYDQALSDYHKATDAAARRQVRDRFIAYQLAVSDLKFIRYARSLSDDKRLLDAATEGAQLTLGIAATLVGSAQAKENLAALIALITGGKSIVDKNFYENRTLSLIVSTMITQRKDIALRILKTAQDDTLRYDMAQVNQDLADYHLAGTMSGAFRVVEADLQRREQRVEAAVQEMRAVRNVVLNLSADAATDKASLTRSLDAQLVNAATARRALTELGVASADVPATLEKQLDMLQDIVRQARTAEAITTVKAAFRKAGLVK